MFIGVAIVEGDNRSRASLQQAGAHRRKAMAAAARCFARRNHLCGNGAAVVA